MFVRICCPVCRHEGFVVSLPRLACCSNCDTVNLFKASRGHPITAPAPKWTVDDEEETEERRRKRSRRQRSHFAFEIPDVRNH